MANVVIVGMQWGDEGKGKIVDLISPAFDAVVRFQGGNNAGHTVRFGEAHFSLHLIPSGILRPGMHCALGNGMVIQPDALFEEMAKLEGMGIDFAGRFFISNRAHVVLPAAAALDQAREEAQGDSRIGTTSRGIGPTYEHKASRFGLRLVDLASPALESRLRSYLRKVDAELASLGASPVAGGVEETLGRCVRWQEKLAPYLSDTELLLHTWLAEGKSLLLEGAQGTLLDLDHGTFPFVTSSSSTAGGACTGTGLPPTALDGAIGVLKAYTTRVGGGPFTTELHSEVAEYLRRRGNEYGTTTGRPRRCGWLDLVGARYAQRLNGISAVALTKLDVLDDLEEIPVCVGYRENGEVHREYSARFESGEGFEPEYRVMKGWRHSTVGILDFADLPQEAKDYVDLLEQELGVPMALISSGPRREETIVRDLPVLERLTDQKLAGIRARLS